jgi:hypothetical protein
MRPGGAPGHYRKMEKIAAIPAKQFVIGLL